MSKILSAEEALHRAAALCSTAERCSYDLREKLANWGISHTDTEKIIRRLSDEKFLDDNRFCTAFARDKFRFTGWGRVKIAYALRQKRLPDSSIDEALSSIDEDTYRETLQRLLHDKERTLKDEDNYTRYAKLFRFATSRGFEPQEIGRCLKEQHNDD